MFDNYFRKILSFNPEIPMINNEEKINRWIRKWGVFGMEPSTKGYRLYSSFVKDDINIVPNEIARNYIEPILTPEEYQPFYNDKNSFGVFLDSNWMPKTFFRSINGLLYDGGYNPINASNFISLFDGINEIVVKPSKAMGGKGISLFKRINGGFVDDDNNTLTLPYLNQIYNKNFLIQECFKQNDFMAQFNPTSVNTIRIATYRDVKSGEIVVLGCFLRIGGRGSFVDNISSGGSSVPIDNDGKLGNYACDNNRRKHKIYNGINFAEKEFIIPEFEKVKRFVCEVAKRMPHMSLFANDIAIDKNGNPKLIEVNTIQFSYTFYQISGNTVWGKYTDDLIDYCLHENKKVRPSIFLKYN
jgi:hypothetical protein